MIRLFVVSAVTVGFETALTRFFALAEWQAYGYWVISIVLAGFAFAGVILALAPAFFARRARPILDILPGLLIAAIGLGYWLACIDPFNPLQLQNPVTLPGELVHIGLYYACLLPAFTLAGLYIGLSFLSRADVVGRVYAADLLGAGVGAGALLALTLLVSPFRLVAVLVAPLVLTARGRRSALLAVAALVAVEALLVFHDQAHINDFKPIYAPLHAADARVVATRFSPRGLYQTLADYNERVDADLSDDASMLDIPGPPRSLGLYRDGVRIAALPLGGRYDVRYAPATLDALPYVLLHKPSVLLIGGSGGFRIAAAQALGAGAVIATETDPVIRVADAAAGPTLAASPIAVSNAHWISGQKFDLVDIGADFLDSDPANGADFSAPAIAAYLRALTPGGMVSIPVSIREFPAYGVRMLATVREALKLYGARDPLSDVLVYRSAWSLRVLVAPGGFSPAMLATAGKFCGERSFDISYVKGMDVAAARANIFNDLPSVSFDAGTADPVSPDDAVADEAGAALAGRPTASAKAFDLRPITYDRPFYYAVLRLDRLPVLLARIQILPQAELNPLVSLAVLVQAIPIALIVLLLPLLAGPARAGVRAAPYFASLGLGFLFIELWLIEQASFYLDDATAGFALVLTGMLVFAGLGSFCSGRIANARRTLVVVAALVALWALLLALFGMRAMLASLDAPFALRVLAIGIALAPVSFALGLPFPLGLAAVSGKSWPRAALPWAWGINGAFSVVATPLANLLSLQHGYRVLLIAAVVLYGLAAISFPKSRTVPA